MMQPILLHTYSQCWEKKWYPIDWILCVFHWDHMLCCSSTGVHVLAHKVALWFYILVLTWGTCMPWFVYIFGSAVPLILYGIQHYFSMIGSLVLIPLVIVPAMDGNSVSLHSSDTAMFLVVALQCQRSLFPCWQLYCCRMWASGFQLNEHHPFLFLFSGYSL